MKLLHVKTARSIWLVDSNDINPRGIDISFPLSAIAKRYGFQKYPKTLAEADENSASGIVYEQGHFETEAGRYEIDKVSMHNDGLVVNNRQSTDLGELFLEDALSFLAGEFGLTYQHGMVHKKIYTSELIVKTEKDLGTLFSPLDPIQKRVGDLIGHKMGPFGFKLNIDVTTTSDRPAMFIFEREVNKPIGQQRYYSSAPLKTDQHLGILQELEALL